MNRLPNWKILQYFKKRKQQNPTTTLEYLHRDIETDIHLQPTEDLLRSLQTNAKRGLSTAVARDLLNKTGPNVLTPAKKTSNVLKFMNRCFGGFSALIWVYNYE